MGAKSSVSAWSRVSRFTEFETGEGPEGPASPRRRRGGEWPECGLIVRAKNSGAVGRAIVSKEANAMPGNLLIRLPNLRCRRTLPAGWGSSPRLRCTAHGNSRFRTSPRVFWRLF